MSKGNDQPNLRLIRTFLLSFDREKIAQRGRGLYCILIPGSLSDYPHNKYPEFYANGRLPEMRCQGKKYILVFRAPPDVFQRARSTPGRIRMPSIYKGKPIERAFM